MTFTTLGGLQEGEMLTAEQAADLLSRMLSPGTPNSVLKQAGLKKEKR